MQADTGTEAVVDRLFGLAVMLGELMNRRLAEHGLTPARAEVLWLLHYRGPQTQRDLSQALKCTPRNVSGLVDVLQHAGFVARNPHPTDRRALLVTLTDRGQALAAAWQTDRGQGTEELLGDTSPTELATFTEVLDRILGRLGKSYERS